MHGGTAVSGPEDGAADERTRGNEETGQGFFRVRDDGELALEGLASAPEQGFDCSDLNTFVVRDLLVGPPGALTHGEHVTVAGGKPVERPVHQLAVDGRQQELLRGVFCDDTDRLLR